MLLADKPINPVKGVIFDSRSNSTREAILNEGMTYRMWLAGLAMQALLSNPNTDYL